MRTILFFSSKKAEKESADSLTQGTRHIGTRHREMQHIYTQGNWEQVETIRVGKENQTELPETRKYLSFKISQKSKTQYRQLKINITEAACRRSTCCTLIRFNNNNFGNRISLMVTREREVKEKTD